MPIYEFRCAACGTHFEERLALPEVGRVTPPCPRCGRPDRVERELSTFQPITSRKT